MNAVYVMQQNVIKHSFLVNRSSVQNLSLENTFGLFSAGSWSARLFTGTESESKYRFQFFYGKIA